MHSGNHKASFNALWMLFPCTEEQLECEADVVIG